MRCWENWGGSMAIMGNSNRHVYLKKSFQRMVFRILFSFWLQPSIITPFVIPTGILLVLMIHINPDLHMTGSLPLISLPRNEKRRTHPHTHIKICNRNVSKQGVPRRWPRAQTGELFGRKRNDTCRGTWFSKSHAFRWSSVLGPKITTESGRLQPASTPTGRTNASVTTTRFPNAKRRYFFFFGFQWPD